MVGLKHTIFEKTKNVRGETHWRIDLDNELDGAEVEDVEEATEAIQ